MHVDHPGTEPAAPAGTDRPTDSPTDRPTDRPAQVEVRILGPVDVAGAARPFRRPWALELVVYLALHPAGVGSDAWASALWPDRVVADPTRHSTVSAARRSLGRSPAGHDHLPRGRGVLRLAGTVGTDWDRFCRLAGAADPAAWSRALSLVRGRPFDGLRGADWAVLEGVGARIEDAVVQTALRLADHHLDLDDGRAAEVAVRRALPASPYDERLYRRLLEAADRQGNPAGVESAMAELVLLLGGAGPEDGRRRPVRGRGRSLAEPPDLADWVHPETIEVYRALRRGRCRVAASGHRR